MRRTWWFRPFAVLFTLWFPLVVGEPSLLQPCPTHGAVATAAAAPEHNHGAPVAFAHSGHAVGEQSGDQAPSQQHHCTCIGCCAGSAGAALAPLPPTTSFVTAAYEIESRQPTAESLPRPAPDYSHPFNTGPPRV